MAMFDDLKQGLAEVDAFLSGEHTGAKVTIPAQVDVKIIRKRLNMTQAKFASAFGFSLDTIKHWEAGRRNPEGPARALLTVISKNPKLCSRHCIPKSPSTGRRLSSWYPIPPGTWVRQPIHSHEHRQARHPSRLSSQQERHVIRLLRRAGPLMYRVQDHRDDFGILTIGVPGHQFN